MRFAVLLRSLAVCSRPPLCRAPAAATRSAVAACRPSATTSLWRAQDRPSRCIFAPLVPLRGLSSAPPLSQGLAAIVKLDLFSKLPPDEVVQVWASFHATKPDTVATTAAPRDWQVLKQRASECSLFAFPLFQNEGYVTMLCQFAGDSFVLVPLQAVKDHGDSAKPWLMVSYYDELALSKGVVLVRGTIMEERMTKVECDVLMHLLHRQYSVDTAYGQVLQFTHYNDQFDWESHVMQCKDAVEQVLHPHPKLNPQLVMTDAQAVAELARAKLLLQKQQQDDGK